MKEDIELPDDYLIDVESLDDVTEEEWNELEEKVDQMVELLKHHQEEIDQQMQEINDSPVYEKLGVELRISNEATFSFDER